MTRVETGHTGPFLCFSNTTNANQVSERGGVQLVCLQLQTSLAWIHFYIKSQSKRLHTTPPFWLDCVFIAPGCQTAPPSSPPPFFFPFKSFSDFIHLNPVYHTPLSFDLRYWHSISLKTQKAIFRMVGILFLFFMIALFMFTTIENTKNNHASGNGHE